MKNIELKPCPFCGGKAALVKSYTAQEWWVVKCANTKCYLVVETAGFLDQKRAIETWNTRKQ